jgi:hypothetical protein
VTVERTHEEIAEFLGAFALDAVDPEEAEFIEAHLASCPRCRAELASYREVAAALAYGGATAPGGLWARIASSLTAGPPEKELSRLYPLRASSRRSISLRLFAAVAAVAASVIVVLGLRVNALSNEVDRVQTAQASTGIDGALQRALLDPSAARVSLVSADKRLQVDVVLETNGTGYLVGGKLPALIRGRTYQLWAVAADRKVSLGVLGSRPNIVPFRVSAPIAALAVTDELLPGVVTTQQQPLVVGKVDHPPSSTAA